MFYAISMVNIERKYYRIYRKGNERGSKTHYYKNAIKHKENQEERKERTKKLQDIQIGKSKFFPVGDYFPCKWIKLFNQKKYMGWAIKKKKAQSNYLLSTRDSL